MQFSARRWAWVAACGALAACGAAATSTPGQSRGTIAAASGGYAGAYLGMTIAALERRLGRPLHTNDNPYYTPAQAPPLLPSDNYRDWVYPDVGVTFVNGRVASLTVYGLGAATGRGVGIGDPAVQRARGLSRGALPTRRAAAPTPWRPGCQVNAGRGVYMYFGDDPIKLIALSAYPFPP